MRHFGMILGVLALAVAAGGCASVRKHFAGSPATTRATPIASRKGPRITYPAVGVTLTAAPHGYRPTMARAKVLASLRHTPAWPFIRPKTRRSVRVQMVSEGRPGLDAYPAWVLTYRRARSNCVFVSIYSLRTRVWTWHFHTCTHRSPIRPSCDFGCTPSNQDALDAAAHAAERVATQAYYTGLVVNASSNSVTVYLSHAPQSVLDRLRATRPGIYVIHNDAPRPLRSVMKVMRSIDIKALQAQGIKVTAYGPTVDGYLRVGVSSHVAEAQATLDAIYGPNLIRVVKQAPATAL